MNVGVYMYRSMVHLFCCNVKVLYISQHAYREWPVTYTVDIHELQGQIEHCNGDQAICICTDNKINIAV